MLTNWMPKESLAALNDGFVVAIMLEAKPGEGDALAGILRDMTPPTMAEPKVKLFLPYRSPPTRCCSSSSSSTSTNQAGRPTRRPIISRPR